MPRRYLLRLLTVADPGGDYVSDGELLRRFTRDRDQAAFELIVRRHADAVWAACRGILRSEADAEDAFQTTFLVLVRQARAVRGEHAGGWLHRVAVTAALKLRGQLARATTAAAAQLEALPAPATGGPDTDLTALLQEELAGLPERFRAPVVLCELEGQTHAEAAQALGWPVGTVSSRLSRARGLLRARLVRRGVPAPTVLFPALVLPPALVRDATAAAVGATPALPAALALAEGVLVMMRSTRYQLLAATMASVGLLTLAGFGTLTALAQRPAHPEADRVDTPLGAKAPAVTRVGDSITAYPELDIKSLEDLVTKCPKTLGGKMLPVTPDEPALVQLQKAKLNAVLADAAYYTSELKDPRRLSAALAIPDVCARAVAAASEVFSPAELRPWLEERVRVAKWWETVADAKVKGGVHPSELYQARYARLDAEIALMKLTARPNGAAGR